MKNSRGCWKCGLSPILKSILRLIESNFVLQILEIGWHDDFLVMTELFEGGVALSHDFDVVADAHVVLVHHLNVFPLLKRTEQL